MVQSRFQPDPAESPASYIDTGEDAEGDIDLTGDPALMSPVEYVVEKSGVGKVVYFIACREEGDQWVAGFFPAYMSPDPGDDTEDEIFDLANPDHTVTGPSREAAQSALREWIEATFTVHERREQRQPL
jgi:hypothetical protein